MGKRKGAIELSLGFIVMVVFAVVLLSLAIIWLQGLMAGINPLTNDLIQQAQTKIQDTFAQTSSNFAIWPNRYELARGRILKMSAGLKNNDVSGQDRQFFINVIPSAASNTPCPGGDITQCQAPGDVSLIDYMKTWVTFPLSAFRVQINQIGYKDISITIPDEAVIGTYHFDVVACCKDCPGSTVSSASQCDQTTLNWGGSSQPLEIVLISK